MTGPGAPPVRLRRAVPWLRTLAGTAAGLAVRPGLWVEAARQAAVFARPGARDWRRFRLQTSSGPGGDPPSASEVVAFIAWARHHRRCGGH